MDVGAAERKAALDGDAEKSDTARCYRFAFFCILTFLLGLFMMFPVEHQPVSAQGPTPTPTCTQPDDVDIAFAFCDAAHDDLAGDYASPLKDVSTDGYLPPVILRATGWYETQDSPIGGWAQCVNGNPYSSPSGCDWGIMQIWSGMNCDDPGSQFNTETQQQVKYDHRYNVAMGAYILKKWKWDWHQQNGRIIGNGDSRIAEHWYYAVWAYHQWTVVNSPNNPIDNPCPNWPNDWVGCAYQDKVWWWAAHPPSRNGRTLWSAVNLTRPNPEQFPRDQPEMDTWPDWQIPAPTPTHRDSCRAYLPIVMKGWTNVFLFDTFNPINGGWVFYTGDTGGEYGVSDYVRVYTTDGHDDTYSLFITEQVGVLSYPSGAYITLDVPPGISPLTLSYWYKKVGTHGGFHVLADGQMVSSGSGSSTWQRKTADISPYAADGQVTLDFRVPYGYGGPHALLFDEIAVSTQ